ncbi:Efflux pump periplasmic linker BepF [Gammaproteobacteria bacterium MOLA455]|nr:Efflux pump periplasmic linker BepF [Gammaproteobacteria bacterium MOLA455]
MKSRWIWIAALSLLIALVYFLSRPTRPEVHLVELSLGLVENSVSNTRAGTVKACQRSKLSLPIGGQIAELYVHEGQEVSEGQLLMSLWNDDRRAQVEQAKATARALVKERQSICIGSTSDRHESERLTALLDKKLVSSERADLALAKSNSSAAACEAAKARIAQAKASVKLAEAVLAQTYLHAPFAGRVAEVTGELGEFSTPSPPGVQTPPAIDLLTDNCHYISAPIDEVDASQVAVGMPVRVTMDAFRERNFPAVVRRISTYVLDLEKQARTVEVEAELDSDEQMPVLLAGYSADMDIILDAKSSALRVPTEMLVDEKFVLMVNQDGRVERRELVLGLSNWHFSEVISGALEGDRIIGNIGTQAVVDGAEVRVVDAP